MLTIDNELYVHTVQERYIELDRYDSAIKRCDRFCDIIYFIFRYSGRIDAVQKRVFIKLMNCKKLFPSVSDKRYFLQYALDIRHLEMIKLFEAGNLKIHEVRLEDGRSALHYLTDVIYGRIDASVRTRAIMDYFLDNPENNYQDDLGYTYLHGACMAGNLAAVNLLLSQGVDVNLDTYTCSPLHIAAEYRHADVVEILLTHGANPNLRDAEKFTPLHALSRLCLCQCRSRFCDKRKPVDKLVKLLLDHGADIEARNRHGYTPLELSVCRLDLELTRTLLKYGAKLDNLNEDKMFKMTFTQVELKNYPLTLNIIEMAYLLKSAGYTISLQARLRMMKYWMKIRGNDTDHLISKYTGFLEHVMKSIIIKEAMQRIFLSREFGFYLPQETEDVLLKKCKHLLPFNDHYREYKPCDSLAETLTAEVESTRKIMLTKDVSLYEMLRMSYSEGYSLIKGIKNWRLPAMDGISCTYMNMIAKRHLANVLIRPHLEWLVAELFTTDHCQLHLPYLACLKIAEHMSDEDLFRLCEQKNENQLNSRPISHRKRCSSSESVTQTSRPNTISCQKRCNESGSSASSEPPKRRSRRLQGLSASENQR